MYALNSSFNVLTLRSPFAVFKTLSRLSIGLATNRLETTNRLTNRHFFMGGFTLQALKIRLSFLKLESLFDWVETLYSVN
jgi:hypothetical protein